MIAPARYRKLPVVIEAIRYDGGPEALAAILAWTAGSGTPAEALPVGLTIHTLEGAHLVSVGDFVVRGVKGEHYPVKPDVFERTYEAA